MYCQAYIFHNSWIWSDQLQIDFVLKKVNKKNKQTWWVRSHGETSNFSAKTFTISSPSIWGTWRPAKTFTKPQSQNIQENSIKNFGWKISHPNSFLCNFVNSESGHQGIVQIEYHSLHATRGRSISLHSWRLYHFSRLHCMSYYQFARPYWRFSCSPHHLGRILQNGNEVDCAFVSATRNPQVLGCRCHGNSIGAFLKEPGALTTEVLFMSEFTL